MALSIKFNSLHFSVRLTDVDFFSAKRRKTEENITDFCTKMFTKLNSNSICFTVCALFKGSNTFISSRRDNKTSNGLRGTFLQLIRNLRLLKLKSNYRFVLHSSFSLFVFDYSARTYVHYVSRTAAILGIQTLFILLLGKV